MADIVTKGQRQPLRRLLRTAENRTAMLAHQQELLERLAEHDRLGAEWARQRRAIIDELTAAYEWLYPRWAFVRSRRPPAPDVPPLPAVAEGAELLGGVELRATCLALLERHGPSSLTELQTLLHLDGYAVRGDYPPKVLADALRYEARQGRVVRLRRGVYAVPDDCRPQSDTRPDTGYPSTPRPTDPVVRLSPGWWTDDERPVATTDRQAAFRSASTRFQRSGSLLYGA